MAMDTNAIAEPPPGVHAGSPLDTSAPEVSPSTIPIEPLDLIENPKVRTKLGLYSILSALYVNYPAVLFNDFF
jgi:hypothetical protein